MIRGNTIKSSFKKKQQQQKEIRLEQEILEDEVNFKFNNMSEEKSNNLENKKNNLKRYSKGNN